MNRNDFRFFDRLRVRWAEVDMQQIVFNGHYLMYFDTAVAGYWRALALPYTQTMHDLGGDLYVRKATLEYEGSARYDEQLDVGMRCERIGNSSMLLQRRGVPRRAAAGHRRAGLCLRRPGHADRAPGARAAARRCCRASRPAQPMLDVRVGTWDQLGREAQAIRHAVFVAGAGHPGRARMGRGRRLGRARAGRQPLGRGGRHRAAAGARARRVQDRPHGGAADRARRRRRRARCSTRLTRPRARAATAQLLLHAQTQRGAASTCAPGSRRGGRCSRRPASRTRRWCARPERCRAASRPARVEDLDMARAQRTRRRSAAAPASIACCRRGVDAAGAARRSPSA